VTFEVDGWKSVVVLRPQLFLSYNPHAGRVRGWVCYEAKVGGTKCSVTTFKMLCCYTIGSHLKDWLPTSCKQSAAGFMLGVTKLTSSGNDKTV
jgi:hypothetical protein